MVVVFVDNLVVMLLTFKGPIDFLDDTYSICMTGGAEAILNLNMQAV